jgi:SsrA-binding protein
MPKDKGESANFQNRRARFDYAIETTFEAGVMLVGSEVKALRLGQASLNEAFAIEKSGEIFLVNCTISPYGPANHFNHEPKRHRKLLLKKREINQIVGALTRERLTLVPLSLTFNEKGRAKILLGLGKGKKNIDKRETIKQRDWTRQKARTLRGE